MVFLYGAFFLTSAVGFVTTAFMARRLTAVGYGKIAFAQALLVYFSLIGDLGLSRFGIREVARLREKEKIKQLVNNVLTLQLSLSAVAVLLMVLFSIASSRPHEDKVIIILYSTHIVFNGLLLDWAFKGLERMETVALSQIIGSLLGDSLILFLVRIRSDTYYVPLFYLAGLALKAIMLAALFMRDHGFIRFTFDRGFTVRALKSAIPLFFSFILIQVYYNLDTVMLGFMKSDQMVGLYSAAYRIIMVLIAVGALLHEVLFPLYSRFYKESPEKLKTVLNMSIKVYCTFAVPIAVGGILIAKPLIVLVFGQNYEQAARPFQILILTVAVIYISFTFGFAIMACDREKRYMVGVGLGAIVNIILNSILIPPYDMNGAAVATLASEMLVLIYMFLNSRSITKIDLLRHLPRPLVASGIMAAVMIFSGLHVLANIAIGAVTYTVSFLIMKGVSAEDVRMFREYVLGKK